MHPSPEDDGQEEKPGLGPSRPIVRPCGQVPCIAFVFNPRFFRGPLAIVRVLPALFCAAGALPFPVVVHSVFKAAKFYGVLSRYALIDVLVGFSFANVVDS